MKITQADIAKHLDVSRLTVNKALKNESGVSAATRLRVLEVAKELGYQASKALPEAGVGETAVKKSGTHHQITLFSTMGLESDSYWAPVIRGISSILAAEGFSLNLCFWESKENETTPFPLNFKPEEIDGIIQFGNYDAKQMRELIATGLPIVSIDTNLNPGSEGLICDTVMNISTEPMMRLVGLLHQAGYGRIGYVSDILGLLTMDERWLGYQQGMAAMGLEVLPEDCFFGSFEDLVREFEGTDRLNDLTAFPDVLICCNDMHAIGVKQYLMKNGIQVPAQVAITGFDNVSQAEIADLTTIAVDKEEIGKTAADLMLWRLKNLERPYRMARLYSGELIQRGSTKRLKPEEVKHEDFSFMR